MGYQPVGMKPSGVLAAGFLDVDDGQVVGVGVGDEAASTHRARAPASWACCPAGRLGSIAVPIVSMALPASVSITLTVLRLALATYRILPPRASSSSLGCSWVGQRAGNLERLGVDHGDLRLAPEADVEPFARLVPGQSVRVGVGRRAGLSSRNVPAVVSNRAKRVAEDVGDLQGLAVGRAGPGRAGTLGRLSSRDRPGACDRDTRIVLFESRPSAWSKR